MREIIHSLKSLIFTVAAALLLLGCSPLSTPPAPTPTGTSIVAETEVVSGGDPAVELEPSAMALNDEDLDLREANVLDVEFEDLGDGRYRFDVTLLHDDDGEAPSYADSWQVWDTEDNLLGERVLTHSHGTQPFTRSATIEIPEGVGTVLVRGHDMEHGHGGQSMRVDLESGEMTAYEEEGN